MGGPKDDPWIRQPSGMRQSVHEKVKSTYMHEPRTTNYYNTTITCLFWRLFKFCFHRVITYEYLQSKCRAEVLLEETLVTNLASLNLLIEWWNIFGKTETPKRARTWEARTTPLVKIPKESNNYQKNKLGECKKNSKLEKNQN